MNRVMARYSIKKKMLSKKRRRHIKKKFEWNSKHKNVGNNKSFYLKLSLGASYKFFTFFRSLKALQLNFHSTFINIWKILIKKEENLLDEGWCMHFHMSSNIKERNG